MLKLKQLILTTLICSALTAVGNAQDTIEPSTTESAGEPSAAAILLTYRGPAQLDLGSSGGDWHRVAAQARNRAETDLEHARAQLVRARSEVARLVAEIRIEGADEVDIGGEVRAARMVETEWRRAVDTVLAHIGRIDAVIATRSSESSEERLARQSLR